MRLSVSFSSAIITTEKLLAWGKRFDPFILLNSNTRVQLQEDPYGKYDLLIAAGAIERIQDSDDVFEAIRNYHTQKADWIFGYAGYDLKNRVEKLSSGNSDGIKAEECLFFCPRYVISVIDQRFTIHYDPDFDDEQSIRAIISEIENSNLIKTHQAGIEIKTKIPRDEYISTFQKIKQHIQRGDVYELNYCMEFFSENVSIGTENIYVRLNELSPMPFSAYMRSGHIHLMCASPERYLARRKNKIISQPIKGTAKRGADAGEDELIIKKLVNDPKEQSENVMIVDMVRNDLSRTAAKGSVRVEELFGIKSFRQLHHMVSTVVSELKENTHFTEAIRKSFPMGSMTGAPKIRAMQLIEQYEKTKRGIFSGSIGYISPEGDFDFNVIIRSILYKDLNRYLSYMAGSAITNGANAEDEYNECLLKASAMKKVLSDEQHGR